MNKLIFLLTAFGFLCLHGLAQPLIPKNQYSITAVGNTLIDGSKGLQQTAILGSAVNKQGRVFCINTSDEAQRKCGIYQDGALAGTGNVGPLGNPEPVGGSFIAVNDNSVFAQASNQQVHSYDFDGRIRSGIYSLGFDLSGLAASNRYLVATQASAGRVYVFDLFTKKQVSNFAVASASLVAMNSSDEIFVLSATTPKKVYKYNISGNKLADVITFSAETSPACMAVDNRGRLMIGDNGSSKQILFFDVSKTPAVADGTFGKYGGIQWGEEFTHDKLWNITGCGTDAQGNIYVTMNDNGSFITKVSPRGERIWQMYNTLFVDNGGFDPASDGKDFYTPAEHFVLDFAQKAGSDSKLAHITGQEASFNSAIIRRKDGHLLRYKTGMFGNAYQVFVYDGYKSVSAGYTHPEDSWGSYVDKNGTIWDGSSGTIKKTAITGFNSSGYPTFVTTNAGTRPAIFKDIQRLVYDADSDVMYIAGYTYDHPIVPDWGQIGTEIARYDNWSGTPVFKWRKYVQREYQGIYSNPNVICQAGDYIFYGGGSNNGMSENGDVWIMRKSDGELVGVMEPTSVVGGKGNTGWIDMGFAMDAFRRSNGEYLVAVEEDFMGRNLIYRWCPTGNCSEKPSAYAGNDISIKMPVNSVMLAGSAADIDGVITSYAWQQTGGAEATLAGTDNDTLSIQNLQAGTYTFVLTATDNQALSGSDTVEVRVLPPNTNNQLPVTNAGIDMEVVLPQHSVSLNGRATDADGAIVKYAWSQVSGPAVDLTGNTAADLTVANLAEGTCTFVLAVTDDDGGVASDTVKLVIKTADDGVAPSQPDHFVPTSISYHDISLRWDASTDNVGVTGYEIYSRLSGSDYLVGRTDTTEFQFTGLTPDKKFDFYVVALDAMGNRSQPSELLNIKTTALPSITSIKTNVRPSIDGVIDEVWQNAQAYPLANGLDDGDIADESDFTVTYSTLWDQDSLYMMAIIKDNVHKQIPPFPWESDGVEYYFDMNNDKDMNMLDDNYQLGFAWMHSIYGDYSSSIQATINYKFVETPAKDGYIMEAAVPWGTGLYFDRKTNLPRTDMPEIKAGLTFGFDVAANDDDNGTGRESVLMYYCTPTGTYWGQPNRWGVIQLAEKKAQKITFSKVNQATLNHATNLDASVNTGLPIIFEKVYGNAEVTGNKLTPKQRPDRIIVRALQEGNDTLARAEAIQWITNIGTTAPVANAGPDKALPLDSIQTTIFGSGSDVNGSIVSYLWEKVSGPAVSMLNANTLALTLTDLVAGSYHFKLTVTDNDGEKGYDFADVLVYEEGTLCLATGKILYERWNSITGTAVSNLTSSPKYTKAPDITKDLTIFEAPKDVANNYGCRIRGYICAPQTGNYTFWVAGDDNVELWLSTDDTPANKKKIAYHTSWTDSRVWDKLPSQQSAGIFLVQNKKYYVEALMKEADGGDNLAVGWKLPDATLERPIPGSYLSYDPAWLIHTGFVDNKADENLVVYPNPVTDYIRYNVPAALASGAEVYITNVYGNTVFRTNISGGDTQSFNISSLPPGIYLLSVRCKGHHSQAKFVKQ